MSFRSASTVSGGSLAKAASVGDNLQIQPINRLVNKYFVMVSEADCFLQRRHVHGRRSHDSGGNGRKLLQSLDNHTRCGHADFTGFLINGNVKAKILCRSFLDCYLVE